VYGAVGVAAGFASVAGVAAPPVAGVTAAAGALDMNTSLTLVSQLGQCGSIPVANNCDARTDDGLFPGLGSVTASYTFPMEWGEAPCSVDFGKALAYSARLDVAGKGAINVAVSEATDCVLIQNIGTQTQAFTVTGGTGIYAGRPAVARSHARSEPFQTMGRGMGLRHGRAHSQCRVLRST
jgi:hypothetical protein